MSRTTYIHEIKKDDQKENKSRSVLKPIQNVTQANIPKKIREEAPRQILKAIQNEVPNVSKSTVKIAFDNFFYRSFLAQSNDAVESAFFRKTRCDERTRR